MESDPSVQIDSKGHFEKKNSNTKRIKISNKDRVMSFLKSTNKFDQQTLNSFSTQIPSKFVRFGHILIFRENLPSCFTNNDNNNNDNNETLKLLSKAFISVFQEITLVMLYDEKIKGELREPSTTILYNSLEEKETEKKIQIGLKDEKDSNQNNNSNNNSNNNNNIPKKDDETDRPITETIHIENNIKYSFDVSKIMFSLGNNAERIHFSTVKAKGETIIDMFAGIGYFTLPLGKHSGCSKLIAIEKNPNSFYYLKRNTKLNRIDQIVEPTLGDCRTVAQQYLSCADRISMGYLPTPIGFLSRAFSFLKEKGGIIHYHYLATKLEYQTMPLEHFKSELEKFVNTDVNQKIDEKNEDEKNEDVGLQNKKKEKSNENKNWTNIKILEIREIKSYAPKIFHWVADVSLSFNSN